MIIYRKLCKNCFMRQSMSNSILKKLIPNIEDKLSDKHMECISKIFPCFPDINLIALLSAQYYEKKECKSKMIFLPNTITSCPNLTPKYEIPVELNKDSLRQITKFLVAANKELALVMKYDAKNDSYVAIGMSCEEIEKQEYVYKIQFNGHMNYSLFISEHRLFDFKDGTYSIPKDSEFDELRKSLSGFEIPETQINTFIKHIESVIAAGHGTTMVLCSNVCDELYSNEINRLAKAGRAIRIQTINLFDSDPTNFELADKFLCQTAVADGGFIINHEGDCTAINVIFDGAIDIRWNKFKGLTSRGARYNSLTTYIYGMNTECHSCESKNQHCKSYALRAIAIVISDDGMYNLVECGEQIN